MEKCRETRLPHGRALPQILRQIGHCTAQAVHSIQTFFWRQVYILPSGMRNQTAFPTSSCPTEDCPAGQGILHNCVPSALPCIFQNPLKGKKVPRSCLSLQGSAVWHCGGRFHSGSVPAMRLHELPHIVQQIQRAQPVAVSQDRNRIFRIFSPHIS